LGISEYFLKSARIQLHGKSQSGREVLAFFRAGNRLPYNEASSAIPGGHGRSINVKQYKFIQFSDSWLALFYVSGSSKRCVPTAVQWRGDRMQTLKRLFSPRVRELASQGNSYNRAFRILLLVVALAMLSVGTVFFAIPELASNPPSGPVAKLTSSSVYVAKKSPVTFEAPPSDVEKASSFPVVIRKKMFRSMGFCSSITRS
jgi:hypothetical protein